MHSATIIGVPPSRMKRLFGLICWAHWLAFPSAINTCERLIEQFRPVCNVKGYAITGSTMVTCIQGANYGVSYSSQLDAAEKNGITPGAMSNHLTAAKVTKRYGTKFKRGSL